MEKDTVVLGIRHEQIRWRAVVIMLFRIASVLFPIQIFNRNWSLGRTAQPISFGGYPAPEVHFYDHMEWPM